MSVNLFILKNISTHEVIHSTNMHWMTPGTVLGTEDTVVHKPAVVSFLVALTV